MTTSTQTVDYGAVYAICRELVEATNFRLLEAIAEGLAHELLMAFPIAEVVVRVRKLTVPVDGELAWAGVEIRRRARSATAARVVTSARAGLLEVGGAGAEGRA